MFENFLENRWAFLTDSNAFSSMYIRIALTRELAASAHKPAISWWCSIRFSFCDKYGNELGAPFLSLAELQSCPLTRPICKNVLSPNHIGIFNQKEVWTLFRSQGLENQTKEKPTFLSKKLAHPSTSKKTFTYINKSGNEIQSSKNQILAWVSDFLIDKLAGP